MSEISGGNDNDINESSVEETSSSTTEVSSSLDLGTERTSEEINSGSLDSLEGVFDGKEVSINPNETTTGFNQLLETPDAMELAQRSVENYYNQSIQQILEINGKYMSDVDCERVANGVDSIKAVEHTPGKGYTGFYLLNNGRSSIEVSAINQLQMERSTKHETNHFASTNREIIVPQPDRRGYTVYQTVGTRQASWFHSNETGKDSEFTSKGRGLNEGLTTMYTNQQLMEISKEKGETAERQGIYGHATEICTQLENILGKDTLKEAYYGGNLQNLESKVDSLAGDKSFENLRECLDRTLSRDYFERVQAMKEAQSILARMYEKGESA